MRIVWLPLHIFGAADLNDGTIYLSSHTSLRESVNSLIHELGHLLCGNPDHNKKWYETCLNLYPSFLYTFDVGNINVGNIAGNVGNVTGISNILLDFHLLQAYRKFSQRVLATEGQWELKGDNKIRLMPTPRGSFPVVVEYIPMVYHFRSPNAREVCKRMLVAESKIILGNTRSKYGGIPSPDGGTIQFNGDALRTEGMEEKKQALLDAVLLGEPMPIILWGLAALSPILYLASQVLLSSPIKDIVC
jgi:hypothetical protein